ncbi:MAG: PAS domain S-box protein [Deltaproteobacteria bacterium]|nr:PAS domain S-box protein [Candidatus Zymogenaceae bacterium]
MNKEISILLEPGMAKQYLDIAEVMIVVLDRDGKVVLINRKGAYILEWDQEDLIGRDWFTTCLTDRERNEVRTVFEEIVSGSSDFKKQFESMVVTKNGEQRLISWHNKILRDSFGAVIGTLSSGEDITEKRRVEKERELLFNHSVDMLCIAGFDGYFKQVNPAFSRQLGWTEEELLSRPWLSFVYPDDQDKTIRVGQALQKGDVIKDFQNRYTVKDGGWRWISWNSYPLPDEQLIFAVARDITDMRLAERELHKSEERFHTMARVIPVIFGMYSSPIQKILYISDAFEHIYGVSAEELYNDVTIWFEMIHEEDRERVGRIFVEHIDEEFELEYRIVRRDGGIRWIHNHIYPLKEEGEISRVVWFGNDITERVLADEELRASERNYREIFNAGNDAMFIHDADTGEIFDVNRATCDLIGFTREEVLQMSVGGFSPGNYPYSDKEALEWIHRARDEGPQHFEWRGKTQSGDPLWVEVDLKKAMIGGRERVLSVTRDITDRKKAEEKLAKSETTLRSILQVSPVGIGLVKDRVIQWVNEQFCDMLGYTSEELLGRNARMVYESDEEFNYVGKEKYDQIANFGKGSVETRLVKKDGTAIDVLLTSSPFDPGDIESGVTFTALDITERKQAEADLLRAQTLLRSVIDQSPVPIMIAETDGTLFATNDACRKILKVDDVPDIMPGVNIFNLARSWTDYDEQGNVIPVAELHLARALNGITTPGEEIRVVRKDGTERWGMVHGVPIYDGKGAIVAGLVIFPDITQEKIAEQALLESESKFRSLFETSMDVISITTVNGKFIDINPAGEEVFGYTREELLNLDLSELYYNPEDRKRFQELIHAKETLKDFDVVMKKKDGTPIDCLITSRIMKDDMANVYAYQNIIKDISDRKKLEERLLHAQKLEAIGTLAGGIAHDFNNILTTILGYASLLKSKVTSDGDLYDGLEVIEESSYRAADLTGQLLAFSRKGRLEKRVVSINMLVIEVYNLITKTFDKSIEIELKTDNDLNPIQADESQISQLIMNLVINARDAMPEGGKLTITTEQVEITSKRPGTADLEPDTYAHIMVRDTGKGMDEYTKGRIFEPYFSTRKEVGGTGLGMSVVYGIVTGHGGQITVASTEGEGTEIHVYLPVSEDAKLEFKKKAELTKITGKERVLVIDDEEKILKLLKNILEDAGYQVYTASSGREGLELFTREDIDIDLVILDIIMPEMKGDEVMDKIRELSPGVRVLLASGYSDRDQHMKLLEYDGVEFVGKPFLAEKLLSKVRESLDRGGTTDSVWKS